MIIGSDIISILSDVDIISAIEHNELSIQPFREKDLTPNGYDLRIGEILIPELMKTVTNEMTLIPSKSRFIISTQEKLRFGPNLVGECWIRTTFARKGFLPAFGKIDAGFEGTLTLSFLNCSHSDIILKPGERIVQLVIQRLTSIPSSLYEEKSGNYMGQSGITLNPIKKDQW